MSFPNISTCGISKRLIVCLGIVILSYITSRDIKPHVLLMCAA